MTQEEREEIKQLIVNTMMDYRGLMKDRVKAKHYLDIDDAGEAVAEAVVNKLEQEFELKPKKSTSVRWHE